MEKRIGWIDILRGVTLVSMIGFHFCWDLLYLFHMSLPWMNSFYAYCWQQSICWSFILISGFCWSIGHHPLKRGLKTLLFGTIITIITMIFLPEEHIIFGILSFLGVAMLVLYILDPLLKRIPPLAGFLSFFLVFVMTKGVNNHHLGWGFFSITIPDNLYRDYFTTFLGLHFKGFYSADYFGLFPWIFLYITGYYIHKLYCQFCKSDPKQESYPSPTVPVLSFMGRNSIWIYMLHQPILYGLLLLCQRIVLR